jgi:spermidine/putrescine transport system substrate-binding protein
MLIALLPILLLATLCSSALQAQSLNILTWEAYISDETVAQWESHSGASVSQRYFDQEEVRNTILLAGGDTSIDLVMLDRFTAQIFGERDTLLPVSSYGNVPNLEHIDSALRGQCSDYGSPYAWGTMGIIYRTDIMTQAPDSWSDLLNPQDAQRGHIGLLESYVDTLAPALFMRNASPTTSDAELLRTAFEDMQNLLPAVLTFDYATSFIAQSPRAADLHLALAYSGDQYLLNEVSGSSVWEYVIPQEGSLIWVDCIAVLATSQQQSLALDFINFINTPAIAAANSEAINIASPNAAAVSLQSAAFRNNPLIYPPLNSQQNLHHYPPEINIDEILLRDRIIRTLVNLHESQ